jgi:hypothetical protein
MSPAEPTLHIGPAEAPWTAARSACSDRVRRDKDFDEIFACDAM